MRGGEDNAGVANGMPATISKENTVKSLIGCQAMCVIPKFINLPFQADTIRPIDRAIKPAAIPRP